MSDPGIRRAAGVGANLTAAGAGTLVAVLSTLPLPARIPLAVIAGTVGYVLGTWLGGVSVRAARRARLAPPGRDIYALGALPPAEAPNAGGKGRSLAQLMQAGFRVPPGFVVLPGAFSGSELTATGRRQLDEALAELEGDRFAVRSSAIAEDSATASFAGAFETLLDIPAEQVPDAVRRVRRSRAAERVTAYSEVQGIQTDHELAVVVQRMVSAELAGVLFTAHPLTGDLDRMLGNVVLGPGEALVSGETDAAEFVLHRPRGAFSGTDLMATHAKGLHTAAHAIETLFGGVPQDIEWAVAAGRVWILQSRPITTFNGFDPVSGERNDTLAGNCLWAATNLSEANPEPQTPLTISLMSYLQDHGGPSLKVRGRQLAGYIGGRPYANLTVQLSARGPRAADDPRRAYAQIAGLWGELPTGVPIPLLPIPRTEWQQAGLPLLGTLLRLRCHRAKLPRFLATSAERCHRLTERVQATNTPDELLRLWTTELLPASLRSFWAVVSATDDRTDPVEAELRALVGVQDAAVLLANVTGLADGLESLGPAAGLQQVLAGQLSRAEYLHRFGHRGYNEIELAWPRPAEDPGWLDRALADAATGADVSARRADRQASYEAALGRLRRKHPAAARRIERRLRRRAARAALRESVRAESVRWTGVSRSFALRAGELLGIGQDVFLLTVDEVLAALAGDTAAFANLAARQATVQRHQGLPQLPQFIVGRFDPYAWAADPNRRTDYYQAGTEPLPAPRPGDHTTITGTPGSLGVAEGRVRRLDRFQDANQLRLGEVLVTQLTNIGWTPIFPRAAAIVTDLGAPLSHAAIVARELGIPAVVGCGNATTRLATGDLVRVDGARGTVELLATSDRGVIQT